MLQCGNQEKVMAIASAVSAVYLSLCLMWWSWKVAKSRNFHVFNWVVLCLLAVSIVESIVASVYFLRHDHIETVYFVLDAVKLAGNTAYLFPIVRGNVTFEEQHQNKAEWMLLLCVTVCYTPILLGVHYTHYYNLVLWSSQLLLVTFQLFFASETLERGESVVAAVTGRSLFLLHRLLRKLRYVVVILLIYFMKLIFDLLALMDIQSLSSCNQIPINVTNSVIDLTLTSCVLLLLHPRKTENEESKQAALLV